MKTYPLQSISIEEAYEKQFKLVDAITRNFTGTESLTRGDLLFYWCFSTENASCT